MRARLKRCYFASVNNRMMQSEAQDEQLLDGVAMTMSISCEGQDCEEIPSEASFSNEVEIIINRTSH